MWFPNIIGMTRNSDIKDQWIHKQKNLPDLFYSSSCLCWIQILLWASSLLWSFLCMWLMGLRKFMAKHHSQGKSVRISLLDHNSSFSNPTPCFTQWPASFPGRPTECSRGKGPSTVVRTEQSPLCGATCFSSPANTKIMAEPCHMESWVLIQETSSEAETGEV